MGSLLFNLKYTAKHPEFVLQYLMRVSSISSLTGEKGANVRKYLKEYAKVNADIELRLRELPYLGQMDRRKNEVLYALVRISKPKIAVETGVGAGVSSAIILRAMKLNGQGRLYSIDAGLRSFDGINLPPNKPIGFIIPEDLKKKRWKLIEGYSREHLGPLLKELNSIDLFFHDSEHSYENMVYEYKAAWEYLKRGGYLVSDNIEWNNAFNDFVRDKRAFAKKFYSLGAMKKLED
jgi:predicted O-methyltransferase YrrM